MEQKEFDKTVEILTPKFRRRSDFRFGIQRDRKHRKIWWQIGSVAAMIALVVTIGFYSLSTVRAETIVQQSLEKLNAANSYKVEFVLYGALDDKGFIPAPGGNAVSGTLFLINDGGVEKTCIDYKAPANIREVYDGKNYYRYKSGKLDKKSKSGPLNLLELFRMESASEQLKDCKTTSDGDIIELQHPKGEVMMYGRFSKSSKKLVQAFVKVKGDILLETKSIEYGVDMPEGIFE